jgi:transcriptional regulator with XRE-family HTH domain
MVLEQEIGKAIKRFRKNQNLTQEQLSKFTQHDRTYIGAVERGEKAASLRTLLNISKGLGIPLIDLLKEVEYDGISEVKRPPRVREKITQTKVKKEIKKPLLHKFHLSSSKDGLGKKEMGKQEE